MFDFKTTIDYLDEDYLEKTYLRNKTINYIKNDNCIGKDLKNGHYWEEWMFKYIKQNYINLQNRVFKIE